MRKRYTGIFATIVVVLMVGMIFTGCANEVLYGKWRVAQVGDPETMQGQEPMFPITIAINKDGTIDMLDSPFGEFTKDRQQFEFKQTSDVGDDKMEITGAWELKKTNTGIELYIFPDEQKVYYVLQRLADEE